MRACRRSPPLPAARIPDKKRGVRDLLVKRAPALPGAVMLAEEEPVVRPHDQHGVLPHFEAVHGVEDVAQFGVAHADEGGVFMAQVLDLLGNFLHLSVIGPVEMGTSIAVVVRRVVMLVLACAEIGFMRIEGFDLQPPVVLLAIALDEFYPCSERFRLRMVSLGRHCAPIFPILLNPRHRKTGIRVPMPADGLRMLARGDLPEPGVALMAAEKLPGIVAGVVIGASRFEIMVVIGAEVRVDSGLLENLRHRIVKRLERSPTAMQEVGTPGVQIPSRRHARHRTNIALVKRHRLLRQAFEIGRVDPIAAKRGSMCRLSESNMTMIIFIGLLGN